jgi:hypothetical protein
MKRNAMIHLRAGGFYLSQIDEEHAPNTLAQRMCGGGYLICVDSRWGKERTIILNLRDVDHIVIEDAESST